MATPERPPAASERNDGICPFTVDRASMLHRWDLLTFLHWSFEPDEIQRLLPPGLAVDTFDGRAWVGLVPFLMEVRAARGPALPWISHFCETNVRTYATAPDGTRGVWFLSLDAARLPAVIAGRSAYAMPYFWSKMTLEHHGDEIAYTCQRRWPGPRGLRSTVRMRIGPDFTADELTPFDHFLSSRWRLYSYRGRTMRFAHAEHPPWPLRHAEVLRCDDGLVPAAIGRPVPDVAPIAHWSPGTAVRIGFPHRMHA
jgi:hypothetical protein